MPNNWRANIIEIYGRIKFKNDVDKPIEPLIENEQSKKQDIVGNKFTIVNL